MRGKRDQIPSNQQKTSPQQIWGVLVSITGLLVGALLLASLATALDQNSTALALVSQGTSTPPQSTVQPTPVPGNPTCSDYGFQKFWKWEDPSGTRSHTDPSGIYKVTASTSDRKYLSWNSYINNQPGAFITLVIVKGGPGANLYYYKRANG